VHPSIHSTGDPNYASRIEINGPVHIERDVTFWFMPGNPQGKISFSSNAYVGQNTYFGVGAPIVVGANALIGAYSYILSAEHRFRDRTQSINSQGFDFKGIHIGANSWIGAHVFIRDGTKVGDGAIVGAGAVVTDEIPPWEIWGGVPARKLGIRE